MWWAVNEQVKLALGILGSITALGLFLIPLKTVASVVRMRSTEDYSVFPYIMTLLNCLLWTFYGLPLVGPGRAVVLSINAVGAGLEACYVIIFFIFSTPKLRVRTCLWVGLVLLFVGTVVAVTLAVFLSSESRSLFVGVVADVVTVVMYAAPLEIMWVVLRTRSVKYMPFSLSLLGFSNGLAWTAYSVYVGDVYILIPNLIGAVLGIVQMVLWALYHHVEVVESRRHLTSLSLSKSMSEDASSGRDLSSSIQQSCSSTEEEAEVAQSRPLRS